MWRLIEWVKRLWYDRAFSYWDIQDLTQEWYKLEHELYMYLMENRVLWHLEWDNLVKYDQPRPRREESLFALKMRDYARKITDDSEIHVEIAASEKSGYIALAAHSKRRHEVIIATQGLRI